MPLLKKVAMEKNQKLQIGALVEFATALQTLTRTFGESLDIYVINRLKDCQVYEDDRELQEAGKAVEALGNMSERMTAFTRKLALKIKMQHLENLRRGG